MNWVGVTLILALISLANAFIMEPVGLRKRAAPRRVPPPSTAVKKGSWCWAPNCRECPPPNLMFCAAVSDAASSDDNLSDSGSEISYDASAEAGGLFGALRRQGSGIKDNLLKMSNWASLLCVLDCTILPIVTLILPFFGILAFTPTQMEWLHEFGHQVALYFVMPVGGLATTLNYTQHRKKWITAIGWVGLLAVLSANIGCHAVHLPGAFGHALHEFLHTVHHGILHRVTNLAGCAALMTSNYLSRKKTHGSCSDPGCGHDHHH